MRIPKSLLTVIALLAFGLSQMQFEDAIAQARAVTWTEARPIGEDLPSSWFPEIDTDPYGTVRLVWESVRDNSDPSVDEANGGAIMLSEFRDGEWTEPSDIYIRLP